MFRPGNTGTFLETLTLKGCIRRSPHSLVWTRCVSTSSGLRVGYGVLLLAYNNQNYLLLLFTPGTLWSSAPLDLFICINVSMRNKQARDLWWVYLLTILSCLPWQRHYVERIQTLCRVREKNPAFMMSQSWWGTKRFQRIKNKSTFHDTAKNARSSEYLVGKGHPFDTNTVIIQTHLLPAGRYSTKMVQ